MTNPYKVIMLNARKYMAALLGLTWEEFRAAKFTET